MDQKGKHTLRERLRYHFDNLMSKGAAAKIMLLMVISLLVITVFGVITAVIMGLSYDKFWYGAWQALLHTFDAGTIGGDEGKGIPFNLVMLIVTIFGMFFTATLISIINTGLEAHIERLQRGRSKVLEHNHTVILGFNEITYAIVNELVLANANQKKPQIVVILDEDHDNAEMTEILSAHLVCPETPGESKSDYEKRQKEYKKMLKKTRIVCRQGCIYEFSDLSMCSIATCRSIIVNGKDDANTCKAIMACASVLDKVKTDESKEPYMTAVVREKEHIDTAIIAGRKHISLLCYEEIMSRIIANSSRRPGLSHVFTELFNYDNNEIYCVPKKDIHLPDGVDISKLNKYEINQYLKNSIVIGGINAKGMEERSLEARIDGTLRVTGSVLFPTMKQTTLEDIEMFFVIEEDDDEIATVSRVCEESTELLQAPVHKHMDGVLLIIGSGNLVGEILGELDGYLEENSDILVIDKPDKIEMCEKYYPEHLNVSYVGLDVDDYLTLKSSVPKNITSALILSDNTENEEELTEENMESADQRTLSRLLFMRRIRDKMGADFNITCEMNLNHNRRLAEGTSSEDYIVGSSVTAMMITQVAQSREIMYAFREILDPKGSELYMRDAGDYLGFTGTATFDLYTVAAKLAQENEIFIGIRRQTDRKKRLYEVPIINPKRWETKDGKEVLKQYELHENDMLVVIADK